MQVWIDRMDDMGSHKGAIRRRVKTYTIPTPDPDVDLRIDIPIPMYKSDAEWMLEFIGRIPVVDIHDVTAAQNGIGPEESGNVESES